jgi:hypothetical protein
MIPTGLMRVVQSECHTTRTTPAAYSLKCWIDSTTSPVAAHQYLWCLENENQHKQQPGAGGMTFLARAGAPAPPRGEDCHT